MNAVRARAPIALAAGLAAAAEGALWFFPVQYLSGQLGGSVDPTWSDLGLFVAGFIAAVVGGALLGGGRWLAPALLVVSAALGAAEGQGLATAQPGGFIVAVLFAGGLGARVGALALRDWREPVQLSFGVGAVALLLEVVGSGFAGPAGRPLLGAVLPVFFLGSLASRAASVRLAEGWAPRDGARVAGLLAGLGAAMGVAALFGGAGGLFHRAGRLLAPVAGFIFGGALLVFIQLVRPVLWLANRFHLDISGLQRALARLRGDVDRRAANPHPAEAGALERVMGALFIALLVLALLVLFRRLRARSHPGHVPAARDRVEAVSVEGGPAGGRGRRVRRRSLRDPSLPEDRVRRWYAEALLALRRLRLDRDPAVTPGEFRARVAEAFPEVRGSFDELTGAYERVRYGSIPFDRDDLRSLRDGRDRLMTALKAARPVEDDDPPE